MRLWADLWCAIANPVEFSKHKNTVPDSYFNDSLTNKGYFCIAPLQMTFFNNAQGAASTRDP